MNFQILSPLGVQFLCIWGWGPWRVCVYKGPQTSDSSDCVKLQNRVSQVSLIISGLGMLSVHLRTEKSSGQFWKCVFLTDFSEWFQGSQTSCFFPLQPLAAASWSPLQVSFHLPDLLMLRMLHCPVFGPSLSKPSSLVISPSLVTFF